MPSTKTGAPSEAPLLFLTAREAAAVLRVSYKTFLRYVKEGAVPQPIIIGSVRRWKVDDLQTKLGNTVHQSRDNSRNLEDIEW